MKRLQRTQQQNEGKRPKEGLDVCLQGVGQSGHRFSVMLKPKLTPPRSASGYQPGSDVDVTWRCPPPRWPTLRVFSGFTSMFQFLAMEDLRPGFGI